METPVGNCCWHAVMHPLPPVQPSSQLRRFVQVALFMHSSSSEQQLVVAHCPHCESPTLTEQAPPSAPPSLPEELPPTIVVLQMLPSTTTQSPEGGGRASLEEHATMARSTAAALA